MTASLEFWRTIARITYVDDKVVRFQLPGWNARKYITRQRAIFPEPLRSALEPKLRLHVRSNIGVQSASCLSFKKWEWDGNSAAKQLKRIRAMQQRIELNKVWK